MTTKTTKKKRKSDRSSISSGIPFLPLAIPLVSVRLAIILCGLICLGGAAQLLAPRAIAQSSSSNGSHAHDFVVFATVFNDHGFALYGARTRLRRSSEKKFRWEAVSDHQGELAFRVPEGGEYEITVEARGFKTQTRTVDARDGNRADLTIRMEPEANVGATDKGKP